MSSTSGIRLDQKWAPSKLPSQFQFLTFALKNNDPPIMFEWTVQEPPGRTSDMTLASLLVEVAAQDFHGPPAPPQDIAVQAAATPGTVQVSWKPPALTATGLSNGANVTGYGVYAKGQRPQGAPVSTSVAKAMAREAAQRVAESSRPKESLPAPIQISSWEARSGPLSAIAARRGLGDYDCLTSEPHCCHGDEYHTESSRGSDLSDIMEEDEEELYSEMQLEDGGRRRPSGTSHNALKECSKNRTTERAFLELPEYPQQTHHSKKLFSIPEVAEEDGEPCEFSYKQGVGVSSRARTRLAREPRPARPCRGHEAPLGSRVPAKPRGPRAEDFVFEDRGCRFSRSAARSPDSGLDCGSEEEETRFSFRSPAAQCSPGPGHCPCRTGLRPLLARRRTLTRQSSVEEDSGEPVEAGHVVRSDEAQPSPERSAPSKCSWDEPGGREDFRDVWKKSIKMSDSRASARHAQPPPRVADGPLILGNPVTAGRADRVDLVGRRFPHGSAGRHRSRPTMVPSADEYGGRNRLSPDFYEESETDPGAEELPPRIFVALFDYDPLTMSPNPDAAEEELPFKEGQIIKVYGDKDADGFYRGETCARLGLIPCNMVSEIQADDEEVMDQLLRQGFLPLNTPVEKIAVVSATLALCDPAPLTQCQGRGDATGSEVTSWWLSSSPCDVNREKQKKQPAALSGDAEDGGPVRLRPEGELAQHRCRGLIDVYVMPDGS
ncbi:RIMS-binding protein 2, partial [Eschrichtius robustus]|nr:RIMS-binding protein 2 [Eschrichtius robustus]